MVCESPPGKIKGKPFTNPPKTYAPKAKGEPLLFRIARPFWGNRGEGGAMEGGGPPGFHRRFPPPKGPPTAEGGETLAWGGWLGGVLWPLKTLKGRYHGQWVTRTCRGVGFFGGPPGKIKLFNTPPKNFGRTNFTPLNFPL